MAEQRIPGIPDMDLREAEEIERLLEEEEEKARIKAASVHPFKKYLNPKVIGGALTVMVMAGGGVWGIVALLENERQIPTVKPTIQPAEENRLTRAALNIKKPNIYPLEPFFIPVLRKNKETGQFLHVTAHLVLSNRRLHKDIDKVRPLIRQGIYTLLARKKIKDFEKGAVTLEERLKREIKADSNSYLLSGAGTITQVVFTEFRLTPS